MTAHMEQCLSCQLLYQQIKEFYLQTEIELGTNEKLSLRKKKELVPAAAKVTIWDEPLSMILTKEQGSFPARSWHYFRTRPIVAGASVVSICMLAAFIVLMLPVEKQQSIDQNPVHIRFEGQNFVVLNQHGERLWQKPVTGFNDLSKGSPEGSNLIEIVDLDRDGRAEIVTVLKVAGMGVSGNGSVLALNFDGSLRWEKKLGRQVQFGERIYPVDFITKRVVISQKLQRMFVIVQHNNSPSAIYALDYQGETIGEVWNYGHIHDAVIHSDTKRNVDVLTAIMLDDNKNEPVIISLVLESIFGVKQLPFNRFSNISMYIDLHQGARFENNHLFTTSRFSFSDILLIDNHKIRADLSSLSQWYFSCIFTQDLMLEDVLLTDASIEKYGKKNADKNALNWKNAIKYMNIP